MKFSIFSLLSVLVASSEAMPAIPIDQSYLVADPNLLTVLVKETIVTYLVHIDKTFATDGRYEYPHANVNVENVAVRVSMDTTTLSTVTETSKIRGYTNMFQNGDTLTLTKTTTILGPTVHQTVSDTSPTGLAQKDSEDDHEQFGDEVALAASEQTRGPMDELDAARAVRGAPQLEL